MFYAIDLFCGAGGFSEGIMQAGFHIVYSSDRSAHVKETYEKRHKQLGLIQGINTHFELSDIRDLNGNKILSDINNLEMFKDNRLEEIDVIFGGPPCQGFSIAGKRDKDDPRNTLFREYLRIINEIKPKYVVMENVEGLLSMELNTDFESVSGKKYPDNSLVTEVLHQELDALKYNVDPIRVLNASDFGVPQRRNRAILIASRKDAVKAQYPVPITKEPSEKVTVMEAIGDLFSGQELSGYAADLQNGRTPHFDNGMPIPNYFGAYNQETSSHTAAVQERFSLFSQGESTKHVIKKITSEGLDLNEYPNLFRELIFNSNSSHNLSELKQAIHELKPDLYSDLSEKEGNKKYKSLLKKIIKFWDTGLEDKKVRVVLANTDISPEEFALLYDQCKKSWNKSYTKEYIHDLFMNKPEKITEFFLDALLTRKDSRIRINGAGTAPTMLTLPDDFIHPVLNRILTVREMARIQGFDDSFEFVGKRTTGGDKRKDEVPQYTQVGNAVPPLLAYAIAREIKQALIETTEEENTREEQLAT
ncbi:DNA cytosine methyltransferase [Rossellomorea aquimaris]|uniref:DNA cytosine methyltransferase n=1 Tax=Rossellomorea aquimaris TaxID=189382 RepID=UPI001CD28DA4|nr:DNA cytosine methyltransferase [Rossellomorea aquimaris]MCA1056966.1 DNA cytosine methyltransferase [Rossellomorea aquimaris]